MANAHTSKAQEARPGILIVEDHPIVRRGLADMINGEPDLVVCGEAATADEALDALEACDPPPRAAIVDISLDGRNGIDLLKDIKARRPRLPVLVLSMYDETLYAERALRAGASGYIMKQEAIGKVLEALRRVLAGQVYVSENLSSLMVRKALEGAAAAAPGSPFDRLSDRELEVFQLIAQGLPTRQIAEKLYRSVKTVEAHREHIKSKLGLKSSGELLRYAIEHAQDLERAARQNRNGGAAGAAAAAAQDPTAAEAPAPAESRDPD